jgi:hypothetical protein
MLTWDRHLDMDEDDDEEDQVPPPLPSHVKSGGVNGV